MYRRNSTICFESFGLTAQAPTKGLGKPLVDIFSIACRQEKIPAKGPDTHVPSTPSVQDITSRGEYHRIRTVRLKSQADETFAWHPIGRTPERREIADTFQAAEPAISRGSGEKLTSLTKVRIYFIHPPSISRGPSRGPRVPSRFGSHATVFTVGDDILKFLLWRSPGEF